MSRNSGRRSPQRSRAATLLLTVGALALGAPTAGAATVRVDDDQADCPLSPFTTISAAVAAAAPGDRIEVCPGTYAEQVHIDKPGLQVVRAPETFGRVLIRPPDAMTSPTAIVRISAASTVLRGVTVIGVVPQCNGQYMGVLLDGPSTKLADAPLLAQDQIVNIRSTCDGRDFGLGNVRAGLGTGLVIRSSAVVRTTRIQGSGADGVHIGGRALLDRVVVRGPTMQPVQETEGILVDANLATILHSDISGFPYQQVPGGDARPGYGILMVGRTLNLGSSRIHDNAAGLRMLASRNSWISHNAITNNGDFGILVHVHPTGNRFLHNQVTGNGHGLPGTNRSRFDCLDSEEPGQPLQDVWEGNIGDPPDVMPSDPPEICPPPSP